MFDSDAFKAGPWFSDAGGPRCCETQGIAKPMQGNPKGVPRGRRVARIVWRSKSSKSQPMGRP